MEYVKKFYERVRKNWFKHLIFKFSIIIPALGLFDEILAVIFNNFIYNTPKPKYSDTLPPSLIYDIFHKYYIIVGIAGILILIVLDFITMRIQIDKRNKENKSLFIYD